MPHLQTASRSGDDDQVDKNTTRDTVTVEKDPIRGEANVLLALAASASKHVPLSKTSQASAHLPAQQEYTHDDHGAPRFGTWSPQVSPFPFHHQHNGYSSHPSHTYDQSGWIEHHGPSPAFTRDGSGLNVNKTIHGIGTRRLFSSPIRPAKDSDGSVQEGTQDGMQETKPDDLIHPDFYRSESGRALQYRPDMNHQQYFGGPPTIQQSYGYHYPPHYPPRPLGYDDRNMNGCGTAMSPLKRKVKNDDRCSQGSAKKWNAEPENTENGKEGEIENKNERGASAPAAGGKCSKQRVISPTSSLEGHSKADDDEERSKSQPETSHQQDTYHVQDVCNLQNNHHQQGIYHHPSAGVTRRFLPQSPYGNSNMMRATFPAHSYFPSGPVAPIHPGYPGPPREPWRVTPPGPFSPHGPSHGPPHGPPHGPSHGPSHGPPHGPPQSSSHGLSHYGLPYNGVGYPYPAPGMYPPHQRRLLRSRTESPGVSAPRQHVGAPLSPMSPSSSVTPIQSVSSLPFKQEFVALTENIKSVAEWQHATLATGKAPSANRCLALKAPIPSKYWGEAEKAKDTPIPDFHRLVNYPDYLTKTRNVGIEIGANNGKRNCVMCGKIRVCSASTSNVSGNVPRRNKTPTAKDEEESVCKSSVKEDDETTHIIPRQNKGLCTECDVTVWVVVDNSLEIKWCKGCKNFRPWASFGDKGSATKCVRCRDRQREKYALQKDELRVKRIKLSDNKKDEGEHEMAAAKGLRDLMAMSASSL